MPAVHEGLPSTQLSYNVPEVRAHVAGPVRSQERGGSCEKVQVGQTQRKRPQPVCHTTTLAFAVGARQGRSHDHCIAIAPSTKRVCVM